MQLFDAGEWVIPGVEAVDTSGHTPGHMSFAVHTSDEYVLVLGDALTNHAISFRKPEWPKRAGPGSTGSDRNPSGVA